MDAGKTIKALRLKKGFTQQQMAAKLRISRNAYMAWEKNEVGITLSRLDMLCQIFEISLRDFFEPDEASHPPDEPKPNAAKLKQVIRQRLYFLQEQNRNMVRLNRKLARIMQRALNSGKFPNLPESVPAIDESPPYSPFHFCIHTGSTRTVNVFRAGKYTGTA
jgi:transcriptional regulator with XRE-family HTH domain